MAQTSLKITPPMAYIGLILIITLIFIANLFAGFLGAQVGGAGMISLPVLLLLGIPPTNAIATTKFADIFLNLSGALQYLKKGKFPLKNALLFGSVCLIGGALGAFITLNLDQALLKRIVSVVLIVLLLIVFFKKNLGLSDQPYQVKKTHLFFLLPLIFILGIYGGAIGLSTGTLLALFFVFQGQSFTQAMGISLFISFLIAVSSTVVFLTYGSVLFALAIPQAIASWIGAYFGSKFTIKRGNSCIKGLFIFIVIIFTIKLLLKSF